MQKYLPSILRRQHEVIRQQAERIVEASNPRYRAHLFRQYARAVGGHVRAVDQVVIPTLQLHGWRGVSSDLLIGHARMKQHLAEALVAAQQAYQMDGLIDNLLAEVARQCVREVEELLPLLEKLLADDESRSVGGQAAAHFGLVFEAADERRSGSASELVDEARVVLSTLPSAADSDSGATTS